jgi:hypothetical protein
MSDAERVPAEPLLPPDFHDLEAVIEWAIPTEQERYAKRLATSMDELRRVYDIIVPRAKEARVYLDQIPLAEMDLPAQRLMWLLFSLIMISYPVDVYGRQRVPDGGAAIVVRTHEPPSFPV